ncbi:AfsR/SARP family transcriptional regulator [Actinomadura roseirufa]|uniref:AfsR/SARP family transcriptional regulator n=1 Tax=Actinomadura roseirufa TaxID=2094049 RepID=UPI0013F14800|nr:BTAD domain-containing putative transcriptional regulator [Actinomadura roseirufa]
MASDGEQAIELTPLKWRVLLAILLRQANKPVSNSSLVDALWGERPPRSALANLRMYVHLLRQALGTDDRIARIAPGYALTVNPGELDAHRFVDLVEQARKSTESADVLTANTTLREALGLWRGSAYEGLGECAPLREEAVRLDELRLAAIEERISTDLDLGRHDELVPELRVLTAEHPFREQFRAGLMLALCRSGRQADALQVYRDTRQVLDEELGIEPGPRLRHLEQAILANDPSLYAPVRAAATGGLPVPGSSAAGGVRAWSAPQHLPLDVSGFSGRADELARLGGLLPEVGTHPGTVVIASMSGMAGVGKTALAVHWAYRIREQFPDGALFVDLRGYDPSGVPAPPDEVLDGFLRTLQVPPESIPSRLEDRAAMFRSQLDRRRMLIVLDNAASSAQVRWLLPGSGDCLVVVTSRSSLSGLVASTGAYRLPIDLLSSAEAMDLLREVLGSARIDAEPEAAEELRRLCTNLPLALRLAAERAAVHAHLTLADLTRELADERDRLDLLAAPDDESTAVRAAFSWSYRALPADAARVFRLLGLHPGPDICLSAVAALTGLERQQVRGLLDTLTDVHLVQETARERYQLHDLLRVYARDVAHADEPAAERDAAVRRVLEWYLYTTDLVDRVIMPGRQRVPLDPPRPELRLSEPGSLADSLEWCEAERINMVAAIRHAAQIGWHDIAWKLPYTLWSYFNVRSRWTDWITTHDLGLAAARQADDAFAECHLLASLGNAYRDVHRVDEAFDRFEKAITIARRIGERWIEAGARTLRSVAHRNLGQFGMAIDDCRAAQEIYDSIDDRWGEAWVLYQLGEIFEKIRRYDEAVEHCTRALALFESVGDHWGRGRTLWMLGQTYHGLGRLDESADYSHRALVTAREMGNRNGEAFALFILGELKDDTGDRESARRLWEQALALFEELGNPQAAKVRARMAGA